MMKYTAGDEILRCEPFAHVVLPGFDICDWCLKKSEELTKCKSCELAKYCSSECIDIAWKEGHREECKLMKKSAENMPTGMSLLMARIALKLKRSEEEKRNARYYTVLLPNKSQRRFIDLMTHYEPTRSDKDKMASFDKHHDEVSKYLGDIYPTISMHPRDELFMIYCKLLINSFGIDGDEDISSRVGKGLYLEASVFDHSCWPNAVWVFSGKTLCIRAITDIEKFEDVRINYTWAVNIPREMRRSVLKRVWYFDCHCSECTFQTFGSRRREDLKANQETIPMLPEAVGGDNNKWVSALETSFDNHFEDKEWHKAFMVGCVLLDFYNCLLPPYSITKACVALNVSLSAFEIGRQDESKNYMRLAEDQLRVTHGTDHKFYKEVLMPLSDIVMSAEL